MKTPICFVVDETYLPPAVAQAADILANEAGFSLHIFLENTTAPPEWLANIPAGIQIHHNALSHLIPDGLRADGKWPKIVYGRLFIPQVLDTPRIIYLDADVARAGDLSVLNSIDLGEYLVAAVQDCGMISDKVPGIALPRAEWQKRIGVLDGRYFNSGVIVFNADLWRKLDISTALRTFFDTYGAECYMWDQDFLNNFLQGKWLELSPALNYQMALTGYGFEKAFQPRLVHFTDSVKPWHSGRFVWSEAVRQHYERLYAAAHCPVAPFVPARTLGLDTKRWFNSGLHRLGLQTSRFRKVKARWQQKRDDYLAYYLNRIRQGGFPDHHISEQDLLAASAQPEFDGNSYRAPFDTFANN